MTDTQDRTPTPDRAEDEAFFPSPYSLSQYVPPRTDFDGAEHPGAYTGGRWKVLVIATEERYLHTEEGAFFSTGNHPVETLVPLRHLMDTGFGVEVATLTGAPAKFEHWAFPAEDETVSDTYRQLRESFREPKSLADVVDNELGEDSDYLAVFIPGGHGAVLGLPDSPLVQDVLDWAQDRERVVVTLCHGPAALLASGRGRASRFDGYSVCVFPDALDRGANVEIGYLPGHMRWYVAEELEKQGLTIVNDDMAGTVHRDRNLVTGDSPLASNALGKLAVEALLETAGA
ncbi:glyoxalase III HchA [Corynebacterium bovis]|uniref:Molecular chaperone Hsp31 and glyoxalase 3 n=1 Tax=Corynebacterium bovis DSM 20582 = CIP 54.80 TaxID=927655 RepID=A0A8I0CQB1_9CORY|nr:glyoxalase III HchA [Corynebacterium bovis]MBB3116806.1 molecular chaperone Hsp31 and glyoxalase 3 [Corynebacterium bovis DSM 20582 = CIP 54.80]QQC46753.1 protein deglycase HchA [Corynebacterium bovis]RRO80007.1 protein deglycase HchA [Corynebacterium bovis]RRO81441.1 protein deglycase HchA [Corynebacterium bovis]RRO83065.1 protein deglycase HchA [Corynebacterium bovis]